MEELKISYKDSYQCIYEGMNLYFSKYSIKRKKYYVICFVVSFCFLTFYNSFELLRGYGSVYTGLFITITFIFSALSVLFFHLYNINHVKYVSAKLFNLQKNQNKEIVLKQDEVVFLRDYCKSNYYYDEFVAVIEGENSISFVVEKETDPVVISKTENEKFSCFSAFLKDKFEGRYIDMTKGGTKK